MYVATPAIPPSGLNHSTNVRTGVLPGDAVDELLVALERDLQRDRALRGGARGLEAVHLARGVVVAHLHHEAVGPIDHLAHTQRQQTAAVGTAEGTA